MANEAYLKACGARRIAERSRPPAVFPHSTFLADKNMCGCPSCKESEV